MVKQIPLSGTDMVAIVDDSDYERLMTCPCGDSYTWRPLQSGGRVYAIRSLIKCDPTWEPYKSKSIRMHTIILDGSVPDGYEIDHKNNNGLDNRYENLRVCTRSQNLANRAGFRNKAHKYKGVYPSGDRWIARFHNIHLGTFDTQDEAAGAYNTAALDMYGDYAHLNPVPCIPIRPKTKPLHSKYRGVTWHKRMGRWMAQIIINKKSVFIGYFTDEKSAAVAYNDAVIKNDLPIKKLNSL